MFSLRPIQRTNNSFDHKNNKNDYKQLKIQTEAIIVSCFILLVVDNTTAVIVRWELDKFNNIWISTRRKLALCTAW